MEKLKELSSLIKHWNEIEAKISGLIKHPGTIENIGEYIAEQVFSIKLEKSKTQKGYDGRFTKGALKGRKVNIKIARERESYIDWRDDALPEYFLILTGPKRTSRKRAELGRPIRITNVYLFEVDSTRRILLSRGVSLPKGKRVQASVIGELWDKAEVYPHQVCMQLRVSPVQKAMLSLFG